ncbi:glycosyltransferase family 2 protein [Pseudaestuariivita rosea]|uniref:glycosyltransferase family 2 protein n=1 Tax=Pseudaestuariivita rosea TaxID=2763263 RepID=UPI001ABB4F05|nr:glycosyltransferase [Pseudaestuariivita rosea]
MNEKSVSVIVVSRDRPDYLARCLKALNQQIYQNFEVVVVTDIFGERAVETTCTANDVKLLSFDEPNISTARNMGVIAAAGEIVAFIDDDAVAEPTWLSYLMSPFEDPDVAASGGFVRGRNGISYQWQAQMVDSTGFSHDFPVAMDRSTRFSPKNGLAIKTQGTNMAVRRDVLAKIGGFDPSYRFFLDDTDINMRLARQGYKTALSPLAEVHHSYAASDTRRADRTPRSLFEIGASFAVYLSKYCEPEDAEEAWLKFQDIQRKRLLSHMVAGRLESSEIAYLMAGLIEGATEGVDRERRLMEPLPDQPEDFVRFQKISPKGNHVVWGPLWQLGDLREEARQMINNGHIVTLFALSPTPRKHWVTYDQDCGWIHRGGIWGKSQRDASPGLHWSFESRVIAETSRISVARGLGSPEKLA